jgi:glycosyltransferase involved in cell wall biosynthesis
VSPPRQRLRVLHVAPSFYPATQYGGPIWSTYALCNALAGRDDISLRVLTTDTAAPGSSDRLPVVSFPEIYPPGYEVYFTRRLIGRDVSPGLLARLGNMVAWADVVQLTGTYSFPTIPTLLACRVLGKPLVWSPRGALQASHEWPDAQRPILKRSFEAVCRRVKPRRCVLHATAEVEKAASCARLPEFDAAIIPNAVDYPTELPTRTWVPDRALRLMFISRIDPKKGLDRLLRALPSLKAQTTLDIYGTGEAGYVRALQKLASDLGVANRIRFHGHVDGDAKRDAFLNADLFVLPTHSENFGMVVAEALAHGVPAVVTHGAPWKELDERGCGRWVENSVSAVAGAIEELRHADLANMGAKGRSWMAADFSWEARADDMKALFCRLTSDQPSCANSAAPP